MFALKLMRIVGVVLGLAVAGCGPSVRQSTINWGGAEGSGRPAGLAGGHAGEVPAEYIWTGGAQIVGSSLQSDATGGLILDGRVTAASPSFLRDTHVVRVEVLSRTGRVIWSGTARIEPDHHARVNRDRCGTFQLRMPPVPELHHIHAGVVDVRESDHRLPGTCLAARH